MRLEDFTEAKIKEIFAPFLERFGLIIRHIENRKCAYNEKIPYIGIYFKENPLFERLCIIWEEETNCIWGCLDTKRMSLEVFGYRPLPKGCDIVLEEYYTTMIPKTMNERLAMFGFYDE